MRANNQQEQSFGPNKFTLSVTVIFALFVQWLFYLAREGSGPSVDARRPARVVGLGGDEQRARLRARAVEKRPFRCREELGRSRSVGRGPDRRLDQRRPRRVELAAVGEP